MAAYSGPWYPVQMLGLTMTSAPLAYEPLQAAERGERGGRDVGGVGSVRDGEYGLAALAGGGR